MTDVLTGVLEIEVPSIDKSLEISSKREVTQRSLLICLIFSSLFISFAQITRETSKEG